MNRSDVVSKLKTVESVLRAHDVGPLYLFGSFSRDEGQTDSDIDLFVEAANEGFYDLSHYTWAYEELKYAFTGMRIGYSTRDGLSKYVRRFVEQEAIRVF